jgi:hypothetical protein
MKLISELRYSLNQHFNWNKARADCFVNMLLAVMVTRSVNLKKLACACISEAELSSRYRRLQRFFTQFKIDYDQIARWVFSLFFSTDKPCYLTMDRTNWSWGKKPINILTLGVVFKGTAIPIYWVLLNKKGNSRTAERIALIEKFTRQFGKACIAGLLADREFIGKAWFQWLLDESIPFYIRVKNNTITTNARGLNVDIPTLFHGLKPGEQRVIKGKRFIWGHHLYFAGLRLNDNRLLIVATSQSPKNAITLYGTRWEIETLFGCLKGRGFHVEDTRMTDQKKIKKLLVLLTVAFCWAHKTGEWQHALKPLKTKKHGRLAISLFRYGLDYLVEAILKLFYKPQLFKHCLKLLNNCTPLPPTGKIA